MYYSNGYADNSRLKPEEHIPIQIAEYLNFDNHPGQQEQSPSANSSHSSTIQDSCYDSNSWATEQIQMINYPAMNSPAGYCDVFSPDSVSNPAYPEVINPDCQITSHVNNVGIFNFENPNDQVHKEKFNNVKNQTLSVKGDSKNFKAKNQESKGDALWYKRPTDLWKNASLWDLLWCYGIQSLDEISQKRFRKGKDYIDQICSLVNIHKGDVTQPSEYQIITPSGRVWQELDIYYEAKWHVEKDEDSERAACVSILCEECPFKTPSYDIKGVYGHIYQLLNVKYRCVYCGSIYNLISDLFTHLETNVVSGKGPVTNLNDDFLSACSIIQQQRLNFTINEIQDFERRFLEWTRMLIDNIKLDGHLPMHLPSTSMLIDKVKKEIDYNFVDLYRKIDRVDLSNRKYLQKYVSMQMSNDWNCSIMYWNADLKNTDPSSKSAMFQIVEKKRHKIISTHQLLEIKADALRKADNKCNYDGCPCGGLYTSAYTSTLVEHIFNSNFLAVCVGCKIGFTAFDKYEQHLTKPNCFVPIIPKYHDKL